MEREDKNKPIVTRNEPNNENKDDPNENKEFSSEKSLTEIILSMLSVNTANKVRGILNSTGKNCAYFFQNKLIFPVLFFCGTIIYLEIISHFLIYRDIDQKILLPLLFAIPQGFLITMLVGMFHPKRNRLILWISTIFVSFIFQVQLVYFSVFKVYFSFQTLGMADDAVEEFGSDIITAIKANIGGIILLLIPLIVLGLSIQGKLELKKRSLKEQGTLLTLGVAFHLLALLVLQGFGQGDYSPYDLYYKSKVQDLCGKQLGITTMTRIDVTKLIFGKDDLVLADTVKSIPQPTKVPTTTQVPANKQSDSSKQSVAQVSTPIDTSPNILEIDFDALAKNEEKNTIKTLHQYFSSVPPTNKNKYTGMFKGYNLILITAEGFSPYAVNKEKTPTLYKLVRKGFVFTNFYTALWQTSTSDGEYTALTGLIPDGTRSMYKGRKNYWPFSLGNQFDLLGVESKAYHDHTYTYYQRNETHPNLGYLFKAKNNGLELATPNVWPASDVEMIDATVDEYMNEDQFHVYYLTVSGHMNYTFEGNSMSYKNRNLVKDLPYSSDAKAYIACQMELDMALSKLIAKLTKAGVMDHTVIALSADHYPYGWEKSKLDELAGHEIEPNFEIYRNYFILWTSDMKKKIVIEEPCSSLDILPTLSNLFGLEYDSRLLMGQDILSDAEPLVILSNRSFITDKVMYNSENGEITKLIKGDLPKDYISNLNNIIQNKFKVSKSILENDYYRYVFPNGRD